MTSRAFTIPINILVALTKSAWATGTNAVAYRREEQDMVAVPYRNEPFFSMRARVASLSRRKKWLFAAALIIISYSLLYLAGYQLTALIKSWSLMGLLIFAVGIFGCLASTVLLYLCLVVRDFILTDQFNMTLPLSVNIKRKFQGAQNGHVYPFRIFWSELEELSIIDEPAKGGNSHFFLKLIRKSGHNLAIPLTEIPKTSVSILASQIEKYAPFCRNVSQLAEVPSFQDFENRLLPGVGYEQLWQSLTAKSISATSFAPLPPNSKVQDSRVTVIRQVASGGFSAVYLVEDSDAEKLILKEFVLPFAADQILAKKASEHWYRGRNYYQNGLTAKSQRADAVFSLAHCFFYGDPSRSLPTLAMAAKRNVNGQSKRCSSTNIMG